MRPHLVVVAAPLLRPDLGVDAGAILSGFSWSENHRAGQMHTELLDRLAHWMLRRPEPYRAQCSGVLPYQPYENMVVDRENPDLS